MAGTGRPASLPAAGRRRPRARSPRAPSPRGAIPTPAVDSPAVTPTAPTAIAAQQATATLTALPLRSWSVAVTGANGYFGHRMVASLLAAGVRRIVAIDRVHTRPWPRDRVDVVTVDVRDAEALRLALAGVDSVVHIASFFGSPPFGTIRDTGEWAVNAGGTENVVRAALASGVNSLVYISSSSAIVSGREELVDVAEDTPYPPCYLDFYGPSKAAAERTVLAANQPKLRTAVIRPSGIFGEDELLHVPRLLGIVDQLGGWLPFYFGGEPLSDWTHAENLAWGIYLVLDQLCRPNGGRAAGQVFHITDGEALSTKEPGGLGGQPSHPEHQTDRRHRGGGRHRCGPARAGIPAYIAFFRPFVEACGGRVLPLVPLYLWLLMALATLAEYVCWLLEGVPGLRTLRLRPPMTRLEAFKCCRTHTLSIAKAGRVLGYTPLVSTGEGSARAAADFARKRRLPTPST